MAKDPAALLYIDKWLIATKGMKAHTKGWYLNLVLFQYDMGDLPNDIEELANLCDVRISEYDLFKQVFEQVLKHKFELNENGRLQNSFAKEIIQKREKFKEKRSMSGKISYMVKFARSVLKCNSDQINWLKDNIDLSNIDIKNEQVFKQVLKQTLKLYINVNEDEYINKGKIEFETFWDLYDKKRGDKIKLKIKWDLLSLEDQKNIIHYIPLYKKSEPNKKFRKDPSTFLNNKSWNDEIINTSNGRTKEIKPNNTNDSDFTIIRHNE